jgi:hypothetical protein
MLQRDRRIARARRDKVKAARLRRKVALGASPERGAVLSAEAPKVYHLVEIAGAHGRLFSAVELPQSGGYLSTIVPC